MQCTLRPLVRSMTLWFCCLVHDFVAEVFTIRILRWLKMVDDVKFPRRFYFVWRLCTIFLCKEPRHWKYLSDPLKSFLFILSKRIKIVIWWRRVSTNFTRHVPVDAWKLGCWLSSAKRHIPCLPSPIEQTDGTEILHHLPSVFRSHGNAVSCVSSVLKAEQKRKYRGFTLIFNK